MPGGLFHSLASKQTKDANADEEAIEAAHEVGGAVDGTAVVLSARPSRAESSDKSPAMKEPSFGAVGEREIELPAEAAATGKKAARGKSSGESGAATISKKEAAKRLKAMYAPHAKPLLVVGLLGASVCGTIQGFLGVCITRSTLPFQDLVRTPAALTHLPCTVAGYARTSSM
jgi:hypothetical protein